MAKETFHNLPDEKKERILSAAKQEFEQHPLQHATVKAIIETANISRGSFYQYFDDLEDCYFTTIRHYTVNMHQVFQQLFQRHQHNLENTLKEYGEVIKEEFYSQNLRDLYHSYYLSWTLKGTDNPMEDIEIGLERIRFISTIIHSVIERSFIEDWSNETFSQIYAMHTRWLIEGV